jgi:hypothetical protein
MLIFILVWTLLITCSVYAALAGGVSGRIGATLNIGATLATYAVLEIGSWSATNLPVFMVDFLLMIALFWLALKSDAYWPIWAAGFHLITVLGHAATMIAPDFRWSLYYYFHGMWAIFVQMAMVWGIMLDRMAMPRHR